jgi:hypothetical protein
MRTHGFSRSETGAITGAEVEATFEAAFEAAFEVCDHAKGMAA